ncbi:MAG: hypothetical protein S0880_35400 [Actinomycetota bacterium]|nr:hypothetical protein [Actinomycetota bacterium]
MTGEEAVRLYLLYLDDPAKLRDEQLIEKLEGEAEKAGDPVEKLKVLGELERAKAINGDQFRSDFVRLAHGWAEDQGVPVTAFTSMGVPQDVLAEAGFDVPRGRGRGRRNGTAAGGGRRTQRSRRVSVEEVKSGVPTGPFTVKDLEEASGATGATVRKAIAELVDAGSIKDLGPDREYHGRGRAPTLYGKV